MKKISVLIILLFTFYLVHFSFAQTIYVNSSTGNDATGNGTSGSPYKTFHKGYTMASSGNTINLTGTFTWTDADETGDAATTGYTLNKNLTITGQGPGATIIQAASTENSADRRIFTPGNYTITIQNLTLRHGYITSSAGGAAIRLGGTTIFTLSNCIVERNNINYNDGDGRYQGGAIQIYYITTGSVNIDKCLFQYNSNTGGSSNSGGAIHWMDWSTNTGLITITNSTFSNNNSKYGSAIFARSSRSTISNSTFCNNTGGTTLFYTCGSSSNLCYGYLTNVTVAYNTLGTGGYGIEESSMGMASSGTLGLTKGLMVKNCIVAQNKRTDNTQKDYTGATNNTVNNGYNLVETKDGTASFTNGVSGCIVGVQANLRLSNALAYNSTLNGTQTLALYGGSVAINAGNSSANGNISIPTTDQRGKSRSGNYDIGAFEYNARIWKGTVSTDFNTPLNWYDTLVPPSGDDIAFATDASNNCILDADRTLGSIYNSHSTYQFILNGYTLTLQGDIGLSGSAQFDASSGNIIFSGNYINTITPSSSTLSINNLNINNSKGVILGGNLTVLNLLTLTSGQLTLGAYNLTLGSSATISGTPSASNMIVVTSTGELRKVFTGTGSFTYPVGDNTGTAEYSPITLNFSSGTFSSAYAGVTLANSKHPNNSSLTDYLNRYWTVNQSGISGFSCSVTAQYLVADIVGTESNIYCGKYSGSSWTLLNQSDAVNHRLTGTVTGFSSFTGGQQNVMPAELSSFNSSVIGRDVKLSWTTSSETNNAGFEIQKLNKNSDWCYVGFVKGNGTKNTPTNYSFSDLKLSTGKYQYRLKQIDNNGTYKYYTLNNIVEIGVPTKFNLNQNYPNPFNPVTKIEFQVPKDVKVTMKIYDVTGKLVSTLINNELKKADYYTIDFNASNLSSGIYFCNIEADNFVACKKMILVK